MPIYEYECEQCGHIFEAHVLWTEREVVAAVCPKCFSGEHKKVMSVPAKGIVK